MAATARVSKGKSSKKSIPGTGKSSSSTMKVTKVPAEQPPASTGNDMEHQSTDIPAVPVPRLPPPHGVCVCQTPPPIRLPSTSVTNSSNLDSISDTDVTSNTTADIACNALINVPSTRAGTPKLPSRPGSALTNGLSWSVPSMHPQAKLWPPWSL